MFEKQKEPVSKAVIASR